MIPLPLQRGSIPLRCCLWWKSSWCSYCWSAIFLGRTLLSRMATFHFRSGTRRSMDSPFVEFLLPAVVFCKPTRLIPAHKLMIYSTGLAIPRRIKLAVWQKLIVPDMSRAVSWLLVVFAMIFAGICVVCDTVIWLLMCFALAGPILLSGFYEAYLDYPHKFSGREDRELSAHHRYEG